MEKYKGSSGKSKLINYEALHAILNDTSQPQADTEQ
jgi:hypothetical protein